MRWAAALLGGVLVAGCRTGTPGAGASCVGPVLSVAPAAARAGDAVVVTVEWLREGCNDHGGADEERAMTDVPVTFVQDAVREPLGAVSGTGENFGAQLTFRLPVDAVPGPARVVVGDRLTAELTVTP